MGKKYDIFISYRRESGQAIAVQIAESLKARHYSVFIDVQGMGSGSFPEQLYRRIDEAKDVIVVLSKGSLDRCVNEGDWVKEEIVYAIKNHKNIIPIASTDFVEPEVWIEDLKEFSRYHRQEFNLNYYEAVIYRIKDMLLSEPFSGIVTKAAVGVGIAILVVAAGVFAWKNRTAEIYEKANTYYDADMYDKAIPYLKKAVKYAKNQEKTDFMFDLGYCMSHNEDEEDDKEAVEWYEKAVDAGDATAMNNLASLYRYGTGISQDYEKALELYKKAAEGGSMTAMNNLGEIYENGNIGQKVNIEEALKWYKKATENGYDDAEESVQRVQEIIDNACLIQVNKTDINNWDDMEEDEKADGKNFHVFGSDKLTRDQISSIEFVNISDLPKECYSDSAISWDASKDQNGAIIAYAVQKVDKLYKLYLTSASKINLCEKANLTFASFTEVESIKFNNMINTTNVTSMFGLFYNCTNLNDIDLRSLCTDNVERMTSMFLGCENVKQLDVSNFNTSNATDMLDMFYECKSVEQLDVSNFDTSKVTDMYCMFYRCKSVEQLDVSNFDTSKVTDMSYMFDGCESVKKLDVSNFDTSKVTDMGGMFNSCKKIEKLDLSTFDTKKVQNLNHMFCNSENLTDLNIENFSFKSLTEIPVSKDFFEDTPLAGQKLEAKHYKK